MDRNAQARADFREKTGGGLLAQDKATGEQALSSAEQKLVEQAAQVAGQMLYSESVARSTAELISQPPFPEAIGDAAAQLTSKVDDKMNLPDDLIIPVGMVVAEMVSDLGEEMGFYKEDKKHVQACAQQTIKKLYEIYGTDEVDLANEAEGFSPEELQGGMPGGEGDEEEGYDDSTDSMPGGPNGPAGEGEEEAAPEEQTE